MTNRLRQHLRRHPRTVDTALAAAVFACSFPGAVVTLPGHEPTVTWWPGVLLAGVSCAALLWRRSRPRSTVVLATLCAMGMAGLGYLLTVLLLGPLMVALHSLAAGTDRKTANAFTFTGVALLVTTSLIAGPADEPLVLKLIGPAAWLLLPTALGTSSRLRTAYLEAVQARAEHAERTREQEARHRVTEERMRIARDLHDVVAHHLVLAGIQAGALARALPERPEEAERIVADLSGTTTSALRALKATVGLLRAADEAGNPLEPSPGLAQLADLTDSFEKAGLKVTVTTQGEPRRLSAGADLTAYRIVQEALTNVTKHAAVRSAEIQLTYSPDRLSITITNDTGAGPPSSPAPDSGYGLIGMRERALSVGGRLRAGHRLQGGFEVITELPLLPHGFGPTAAT